MNGVFLGAMAQELGQVSAHTNIGVTHAGYEQDEFDFLLLGAKVMARAMF